MHLFYLFLYSLSLALLLPVLAPFWHILYFIPFIILCFYQATLCTCLWWSLICGFIVDLLAAETRLGNYAINYCLTTLLLYRYQSLFFEDRFTTLPSMAFFFHFVSTFIQIITFSLIGRPFMISPSWMFNDLFLLSFQVAIFSILAFTIPSLILISFRRRYLIYRLSRRRS
ncbi:MAG: hypothetical protein ACH350_05645 [Parachlamydiaceae bacterium]